MRIPIRSVQNMTKCCSSCVDSRNYSSSSAEKENIALRVFGLHSEGLQEGELQWNVLARVGVSDEIVTAAARQCHEGMQVRHGIYSGALSIC